MLMEYEMDGNLEEERWKKTVFSASNLRKETVERLYADVKGKEKIWDFLHSLTQYYTQKEYLEFWDYQNIIVLVFRFLEQITPDDLGEHQLVWGKNEREAECNLYDILMVGFVYAGERGELGYSFHGGEKIREYAGYLSGKIVKDILTYGEWETGENRIPLRYGIQMIALCHGTFWEKRRLLFYHVYRPYLIGIFGRRFSDYLSTKEALHYVNTESTLWEEYDRILEYQENEKGERYLLAVQKEEEKRICFCSVMREKKVPFTIEMTEECHLKYGIKRKQGIVDGLEFCKLKDNINWAELSENMVRQEVAKKIREVADAFWQNLIEEAEMPDEFLQEDYLEILYIYIRTMRGKRVNLELPFSDDYRFEAAAHEEERVSIYVEEQAGKKLDNAVFFTTETEKRGKIRNINALIGKNGSGKTSITNLLLESDIFGVKASDRCHVDAEYCMIYRLGENLYYTPKQKEEEKEWVWVEGNVPVYLFKDTQEDNAIYRNMMHTTVVFYQNLVNPLESRIYQGKMEPFRSVYRKDLSTAYLMSREIHKNCFSDLVYAAVFMLDIQEMGEEAAAEFLQKFDIKPLKTIRVTSLQTDKTEIKPVEEFIKLYADTFLTDEKNLFETEGMSSGESARLLFFARLHAAFRKTDTEGGDRNYLLLLDEIETCFHPTWQRRIIYDLIAFLEWEDKMGNTYKNIQIIMSSNSPFFLSDLPQSKMVYLGEMNAQKNSRQTFGENIHTILKNSFLIRDGLMGAFAQSKIEAVTGLLRKEGALTREEWEFVDGIMELVEEPILKSALQELYENRLEERKDKEARIEAYKKQIKLLEEKMKALKEG